VISYFPTRKPTTREFNECRHIELTADNPKWNPHNKLFDDNENNVTDDEGYLKKRTRRRNIMKASTENTSRISAIEMVESISPVPCILSDISNTLNDRLFVNAIRSTVEVTYAESVKLQSMPNEKENTKVASAVSKPRYKLTPDILASKWNIGLEAA
jgi:CCR4-NOT transcriptional regulation complex NOT5 subunit